MDWTNKNMSWEQKKEFLIIMGKFCFMSVIAFGYFAFTIKVDESYPGWWVACFFAALWLPMKIDSHVPERFRSKSWADIHVIDS